MSEKQSGRSGSHAWDGEAVDDVLGQFVRHLGLQIAEASADEVRATWTAAPHLLQPYGIVHGGVHCSVVETLASVGAATWLGDRGKVVGVNNNTDFFRAVTAGELSSVASPLHRGRSQQLWLVETTDDTGRLVARGQVRLQNLYPEA
jgi:1,4-dihydroxy-2-naphthoyl-CoA hydrolase